MLTRPQTLCLCMIVKNEAPVIRRCLASVRPIIDCWLVVDTGSSDGTQEIVRTMLADLPGELVERPWLDFGHNRSEALALARDLATYSLVIDADDELLVPSGFVMPTLDADCYVVDIRDISIVYQRTQIVSNALPWRYVGVLHEFLTCTDAKTTGYFPVVMRRNHDGRRRRDPKTYSADATILEQTLRTEKEPFLIARYSFYLAQSYRDCGNKEAALAAYLRRADLGFWDQEIFVALLEAARLMEALGRDVDQTLATYERATEVCATRAEALHGASRLCRTNGRYEQGYGLARQALPLSPTDGGLFVEPWIYNFGVLDEFAVTASWIGRISDCRDACHAILARSDVPEKDRTRIAGNFSFAKDQLATRRLARDTSWQPGRPLGGTELMTEGLRDRLGSCLDKLNLFVNMYDEVLVDDRPLVLWMHHDVDQLSVRWLDDSVKTARVDHFVFVSNWQKERYVARFGLSSDQCSVIRNATEIPALNRPCIPQVKQRLAYASTPYRGLAVLLDAWEKLDTSAAELHIWSSHKLYGPSADDSIYEGLYQRARKYSNVVYHGIVPHSELCEALRDCDYLVYPNTFEETSCLVAIEALAAGCRVICPAHGALPETVGEFGLLYAFDADPDMHAQTFANVLTVELQDPCHVTHSKIARQQQFARQQYDWRGRLVEWQALIGQLQTTRRGADPTPFGSPLIKGRAVEVLTRLRDQGFSPSGIIDAGAYRGEFARSMRPIFPDAFILLCDALVEQEPALLEACRQIGNAEHMIALLGERDLEATPFFIVDTVENPNLVKTGSSKFRENTSFPKKERLLPQRRLDTLLKGHHGTFEFIKLDLQGAELDALDGLGAHLDAVEIILLEMSLVAYNAGGPLIHTVLERLKEFGFMLSDLVEEHRHMDGTLLQVDGIFIRCESRFRPKPPFWS